MTPCQVTVLVAVYNTATYLPQCLDSLLAQTLAGVQVVCVDDASTDASPAILDDYARRDARIEVVHLDDNGGQARARNIGLRRARGRLVCFLDSDDWMAADCLARAVAVFDRHPLTDCVLFHTLYYYSPSRQEEYPMQPFRVLTGREAFERSLTWAIHGVYMVRTDIHRRYPYDESAHAFSDDNTTRLHYLASREVRLCDGTYFYRQHAASVSHQVSPRRFDYLAANLSMARQLRQLGVPSELLSIYENHRWLNVVDLYWFYHRHRRRLGAAAAARGLRQIREAWAGIETWRLRPRLRRKFGYAPLRWASGPGLQGERGAAGRAADSLSWCLFRLEEELYFSLRRLLGR